MTSDFDYLLEQYRTLWKNRALAVEGDSKSTILGAIRRELLDENSHPRIRKNLYEKYYLATKRITESALLREEQLILINLYLQVLEQIRDS